MSCHQTSRPSCIAVPPSTASPSRRTTRTCSIVGLAVSASSTAGFSGGGLAAPPAAVGGDDELRLGVVDAAAQRLGREAAEDDRVRAPMRAQASIAIGSSGIIGM